MGSMHTKGLLLVLYALVSSYVNGVLVQKRSDDSLVNHKSNGETATVTSATVTSEDPLQQLMQQLLEQRLQQLIEELEQADSKGSNSLNRWMANTINSEEDASDSAYLKRAERPSWNKLHGGWGKRLPANLVSSPTSRWSGNPNGGSLMGIDTREPVRRSGVNWNHLNALWGKRSQSALDPEDELDRLTAFQQSNGDWDLFNSMWGRRRRRGWNNLNGGWGKRSPNWNQLNGMWGKRSVK